MLVPTRKLVPRPCKARGIGAAACLALLLAACSGTDPSERPPNVLWIVWDTVRADRLSLYGYERETTPFLDGWARDGLVFDDCVSGAGSTLPSHASMFTGRMPTEHGTTNRRRYLDDAFDTLAELFHRDGYRTYLWSANPNVSRPHNLTQGFDVQEHPWDPERAQAAAALVSAKIDPRDRSHELIDELRAGVVKSWGLKASGRLARRALVDWLEDGDERPFFAFVNYMEAHRPYVPARAHRQRTMTAKQIRASYALDRGWKAMWRYVFGLEDRSAEELELIGGLYDATLCELDELLSDLIAELAAAGHLENTVVVLTSDHGEHLGERHLFDHQYSLHEELLRVPLVLHAPGRIAAGRSSRPVSTVDLHATLLELAGIEHAGASGTSLLDEGDASGRTRLAELLGPPTGPLRDVGADDPEFDARPFERSLRAFYRGNHKLYWSSDGRNEVYELALPPAAFSLEPRDDPALREELEGELERILDGLTPLASDAAPELDEEQRRRLRALGYADD